MDSWREARVETWGPITRPLQQSKGRKDGLNFGGGNGDGVVFLCARKHEMA